MDAEEVLHEFIYIEVAGFNLTTVRRRGIHIIGHRAIVNVPGPFVLPLHRMGSSSHANLGLTTLISFLHF